MTDPVNVDLSALTALICQDCNRLKSKLCPICTLTIADDNSCIWCGGVGVVCPSAPHIAGVESQVSQ